jgi:protein TonB
VTSQLLKPARGNRTSRTTAVAVITFGHAAAIVMGMIARGPQPEEELAAPIAVSLLVEERSEPPAPRPRPPEVVMPEVVVPLLDLEIAQEVPPPPITVAVSAAPPTPSTPPAPPVSRGDTSEPVLATSVAYVRPPVLVYPAAAKQARASGTVQIRAVVETDGRVREVRVDRSSGHTSLDKAASEAMRGALFKPYMHNGIARAAIVIVPMDFALQTRGARRDKGPPEQRCDKPHPRGHDVESCGPDLQLDVRGENHHAMRGHAEEFGGLGAAALQVGK